MLLEAGYANSFWRPYYKLRALWTLEDSPDFAGYGSHPFVFTSIPTLAWMAQKNMDQLQYQTIVITMSDTSATGDLVEALKEAVPFANVAQSSGSLEVNA